MTTSTRDHDTQVIVVCGQKGGVGKTTTTVNLSATMAETFPPVEGPDGQPQPQVLAVSTDRQGSMVDWLDRVARSYDQAGAAMPIDYSQQHDNPQVLGKLKLARQYRRIFVDTPGWLPTDSNPAGKKILHETLHNADLAVVPIEPEPLAFKPTRETIEQVIVPLGIPFLVVINNWDPRDGVGDRDDTIAWVRKRGWPLATTVIRRYKLHTTASAAGRLCIDYPKNRVAVEARTDYLKLGLELALGGGR